MSGTTTKVLELPSDGDHAHLVERAARLLAEGGLVAFPTETVYGLGANAADLQAMARLRRVKQRPAGKPFTAMIGRRDDVAHYVDRLSPVALRLVRKGWPGPLTLVFEADGAQPTAIQRQLPDKEQGVLYHAGTIGLRCPDMAFTRDMLNAASCPVAVSSANQAGKPAPTDGEEAFRALDGLVDLVIDGGPVRYRKPSTIVEVAGNRFRILRPGVFDERTIRRLASWTVLFVCTGNTCRSPMAEAICRKVLCEKLGCRADELSDHGIYVHSAGVAAFSGGGASPHAVEASRRRGIDIADHRTRSLAPEHINTADLVLCMTESHRRTVLELVPSADDKTFCLDPTGAIEDPAGGNAEQYEQTAARIEALLHHRLKELEI